MSRALVIIDIQRDYFPGGLMPLHEPELAAQRAGAVLEMFRASGEPVFHIQHLSPAGEDFLVEGTGGAEIMDPVKPTGDETVITKQAPNAFVGTDLEQRLRALKITEVVVVGMMTSMCVDATTRAGADLGFKMTLIPDACAAPALDYGGHTVSAPDVHAAFVAALGQFYAQLTPSSKLLGNAASVSERQIWGDVNGALGPEFDASLELRKLGDHLPPSVSLVDELLEERRAAASSE